MPKIAESDQEILACFDTMSELRPHLAREDFLATVRDMEQGGFNLLYLESEGEVVAVSGFRISVNLHLGKNLYIDDLVTAEKHRSQGYGETLINYLEDYALAQGCAHLHLDSGTHRGRAHKFYFEQGYTIASYHFDKKLG